MTYKQLQRIHRDQASFRDPSGFLFYKEGKIYRQINSTYKDNYNYLIKSGLYQKLSKEGLMVYHKEMRTGPVLEKEKVYKIIKPQRISFISYPYEWSFSQLKAAALITLKIQKIALDYGMTLKDASAYNIQFQGYRPIFIDTLSFEKYIEGRPWVAYRQFCQHFLAPLAMMAFKDVRLGQLLRIYLDGIPLDLASRIIPIKTKTKPGLLFHLYFHSKSQQYFKTKKGKSKLLKKKRIGKKELLSLLNNLESTVQRISWKPHRSQWRDYYKISSYKRESLQDKRQLVENYLRGIKRAKTAWDIGANQGIFSRIAAKQGIYTVSIDNDPACVELSYLHGVKNKEENLLPLFVDITNPSPGIGLQNQERRSFIERGPVDIALVLALIHHLIISNNIPLDKIANFFAGICKSLIIEFIPKNDPMTQKLLEIRKDIFPYYTQKTFEQVFSKFFKIEKVSRIRGSDRLLYLMINKKNEKL